MIDIHSHIIFDVDDGPKTIVDSLKLLEVCIENGVSTIIATSHRRKELFEVDDEQIFNHFNILKRIANEKFKDLKILYGSEIYYTKDILEKIELKKFPTLADSDYLLLDFDENITFKELFKVIYDIKLLGKHPILAHIERYHNLFYDIDKFQRLIESGAYLQVNSSSLLNIKFFKDNDKEYKKRAKYLLDRNFVHFIASDIHNLENRTTFMKKAYQKVKLKYGLAKAEMIFKLNPKKVIENKKI